MYLGPRPLRDLFMSKSTLKSILNVTGSQCKDLRTGVICSDFLVLVRILVAAFWMSCSCLLWKAGEETVTIIHPAGDKGMNKFLQILTGIKTSHSCNVFEMIGCWLGYCFDMTTKTKVCLQNHPTIFDLIVICLTPRVKVFTLRTSSLFPNAITSVFYLFSWRKFGHIPLLI